MSALAGSVDLARLQAALWPGGAIPGRKVYAVLDGARDVEVAPAVKQSGADYRCLYAGPLAPELAAVAPYLVHLPPAAPWVGTLLRRAFGSGWGIFASAREDIEGLRRQLRRLLRVRTEEGKTLLFRFYDPRVLRLYLPTCTAAEAATVFGPIDEYLYEGAVADTLVTARRGDAGIRTEVLPLR